MKKNLILLSLLTAMLSMTACGGGADVNKETTPPTEAPTTEAPTEPTTEEVTEPPTNAPFAEADPNAVTFDDGNCDFVTVVCDDDGAADGTLSVEVVDGNSMLRYHDTKSSADDVGALVQKMLFDVKKLLTPEQCAQVNSISFDIGGTAEADAFVGDDGVNLAVPGWIGGGGGTITMDDKWYGFADFAATEINEYALPRSDMYRVTFKFLLASGGKKWDPAQEEITLQIMRWGLQNVTDTYIDNLTFYDADGNSIPLSAYGVETEEETSEGEAEETEAAEGASEETAENAEAETEAAESAAEEETTEESAQSEEESAE